MRAWAAVGALGLGGFCYVTSENLPVGLLPLMAADLRQSLSSTGLLVTAYGLTVTVLSVPLTVLTRGMPRRLLLCGLLAVFVAGTALSAAAPGYGWLLAARIASAVAQAVFWAVAGITAASLLPERLRGRGIAMMFAGASLALVAGVPAGTWLGQRVGWRAAFAALAALGAVALAATAALLPAVPPERDRAASGSAPDGRRYAVLIAATGLLVTGLFVQLTYVAAFLTSVSGLAEAAVAPALLLRGVAGMAGVACAGVLVDRWPRTGLVGPVAILAAALLAMYALGASPAPAVALLALSSLAIAALPTALTTWVMRVAPGSTAVASAGNATAFNLGIAAGAALGGALLPGFGVRSTALVGGLVVAAALALLLGEPPLASIGRRRPYSAAAAGTPRSPDAR